MAEDREKSQKSEKKATCDNHPDREATFQTDGVATEQLSFCDECIPDHWRE